MNVKLDKSIEQRFEVSFGVEYYDYLTFMRVSVAVMIIHCLILFKTLVILHKEVFWMATIWTVRSHSMFYTGKQSVASVIVGEILYICFSNRFLHDHNACSVIQWKEYKIQSALFKFARNNTAWMTVRNTLRWQVWKFDYVPTFATNMNAIFWCRCVPRCPV